MVIGLLLLASTASAQTIVWSATASTSGATLQVFSDDTYSATVGSELALTSGTSSFHINGSWWTASPAPPPAGTTCSNLTNVDCHGADLFYFNTTSIAECCANCSATPACGAWTHTGITFAGAAPPPYWANRCYIKASCAGRETYAGHTSGLKAAPTRALARLGAGPLSGAHATLGAYTGWEVRYAAGATPITTSFLFFAAPQVFLFNTSFPAGVPGGMGLLVPGGGGGGGEFSASHQPSTQFPALAVPPALRFLTWQGRFFTAQAGAAGEGGMTAGAEGGPLALFPAQQASGAFPALVLAPFNSFKSNTLGEPLAGMAAPASIAAGLNGYVQSVPAGFTLSTSLTASAQGVLDAMHAWGDMLLGARGTVRAADPTSQQLTYWTDNGAYYDFYAYEPNIDSKGVPEEILVSVMETFRNGTYSPPLPVKMLMLDAYWMFNTRNNGNCKMNDTAWPLAFPSGLSSLAQRTAPLIIYNGPQCGNTTYGAAWPLEMSLYWNQGWGSGILSAIAANASLAFYRQLFGTLLAQGMGSFTQDFLDFQSLLFPGFLTDPEGNAGWMAGQAGAAQEHGLALQYCMALPADILQSAEFPAVTNARASQDYGAGGSNWMIAESSLLLSSLRLGASKDNFWTGPRNDRGQETSPFLQAAIATLSSGPVGFADPLLGTNPAVLWPTCSSNGTLLHASRPATRLDAYFSGAPPLAGWDVFATHSALGASGLRAYSFLAASNAPALPPALTLHNLWPPPLVIPGTTAPGPTPRLLLHAFNASGCGSGGPASACVVELGGGGAAPAPLPAPTGDKVPWMLWHASPILDNGYALLGEVGKYVPCSPARFLDVRSQGAAGVGVTLAGAPGEALRVAVYRPGAVVAVVQLVLGADGTLVTNIA